MATVLLPKLQTSPDDVGAVVSATNAHFHHRQVHLQRTRSTSGVPHTQPAEIPLPKASDIGLGGAGTYLLLEEDVEGHECEEAEVGGHGDTAAAVLWAGTRQSPGPRRLCSGEMGLWDAQHPLGSLQRPLPCPPTALLRAHLGLLQPVVEAPEVLGEELGAYGLPVDADPLPHLHQVGRAAGRPEVIGTPFPSPSHLSSETQI